MGTEKFGGTFTADLGHLLPQGDRGPRIITRFSCQFFTPLLKLA